METEKQSMFFSVVTTLKYILLLCTSDTPQYKFRNNHRDTYVNVGKDDQQKDAIFF